MSYNIFFPFLLATIVQSQLNGEFWWLNSKINNLKNVKPTPPKIDISDFQDDESSKIVFRDDDLFTNKLKPIRDRTSKLMPNNNNIDENKVIWPAEEHMKNHDVDVEIFTTQKVKEKEEVTKPVPNQNKYQDVLVFSYPKNQKLVTTSSIKSTDSTPVPSQTTISSESSSAKINAYTNKLSLSSTTTIDGESQNICTYTTKNKCHQFNGFVYEYARRIPATSSSEPLICCILPIQPILNENKLSHTVHFPQTSNSNRYKRSNTETNISLKQREFLLKRKFPSQPQNTKPASTPFTKIVTPPEDEYVDPYWNIKITKPQTPKQGNTKYQDYIEESQEYADELPKPGLIGLYSDHAPSSSSWPIVNGNQGFGYGGSYDDYEDEVDEEDTFGYSTIDPRQGTKKQKQKEKPVKVTTSDELTYDAERHTVNFQSDPDFHVFQGFKLLNLFRNTSRTSTKKTSNLDTDVLVSAPEYSEENEEFFDEKQLFDGCGKVATKKVVERGHKIGEAVSGSHPWLGLVVLTKSRHNVLCYATLVHPRAAITIADCTQGTAPGDVTVMFGLWDLNERSRSKSRVATVQVHSRYRPGEVENNLAVLYWMQPLQLSANIQPACLGHPHIGDECKLFGWGRLDQGIQQARSKWQRATVRSCSGRLSVNNQRSGDAFCVSARGSVTGIGGPLICDVAGHSSVVGVVVSRSNGYVLSPVRDWTMKMDSLVSGD